MAIMIISVQAFLRKGNLGLVQTKYTLLLAISEWKVLIPKLVCKPLPAPLHADNTLWRPVLAAWTTEYIYW